MSMQVGLKAAYNCIKQFSETDFNDDLKKVDVPLSWSSKATTTKSSPSTTPGASP